MKAFDVIGAIREDQSEDNYSMKKEQFNVDRRDQIRISIAKKVQVDSISHEIRKPKFHLVKPKQPPIHLINSKSTSVLGLDTQNQTWTTGFSIAPSPQGFQNLNTNNIRANQVQSHNYQLQNETRLLNPFQFLRSRFGNNRQQITSQLANPNFPNFQADKFKSALSVEPSQFFGNQNSTHQQNIAYQNRHLQVPHSQPNQSTHLQRRLIQSQVQQVNLHNLPQTFHEDSSQQNGTWKKITQFFASLTNKFQNKNHAQIQKSKQDDKQILQQQSDENEFIVEENKNIVQSQVQQYDSQRKLIKTATRQIQLQQNVVIQHF